MNKGKQKAKYELPANFQEKILTNELKLKKDDVTASTLRELLILYSVYNHSSR